MGKLVIIIIQVAIILLDIYIQKVGTARQTSLLRRGFFIVLLMGVIKILKRLSLRLG